MLIKNYPIRVLKKKLKSEKDKRVYQRLQIILLLREGNKQREVSSDLHISVGIVPYWKNRFEKEGFEGLRDKKGRGRKTKLKERQINLLAMEVERGVLMGDGYRRGYSTKDVRIFIKEEFGINYTFVHCRRLMHMIRFNLKVPRPRNKSRNQENVEEFKHDFKKNLKVWTKM